MPLKVAINGFGRIGKLFLRLALQRPNEIQVVAINDPKKDPSQFAYFFKYDSVHGEFPGDVRTDEKFLYIKNTKIAIFRESLPGNIPWAQFGATVVIEASGMFTRKTDVMPHITKGGAKFVLITAPTRDTKTFILGVNENQWQPSETVFSMGSALANALAPLLKPIHERFGIQFASISAIQSMSAQQKPIDAITIPRQTENAKEFNMFRLGRGVQNNIIPSSNTVGWPLVSVLPELDGKIMGTAFRVPTQNVSVVDVTLQLQKGAPKQTFEKVLKEYTEGKLKNIINFTQDDVVSSDFNHNPFSINYDSKASIFLKDNYVKLVGFFDNEWGYTNRIADLLMKTIGGNQ